MIVAGIDVGGQNVHAVILRDGEVLARRTARAGINRAEAAEALYADALATAGVTHEQVGRVFATGSARKRVTFADRAIPEAVADARGVLRLVPSARTVIAVGSEEGRAIKVSPEGKISDFAANERCAAGAGSFVEAMARALAIPEEEMAKISLDSTESISINAQCAVFGESEVVSLIHTNTPKQDIARAVHDAIASRIGSVARIVGLERDIVAVGGLAMNAGFVESLRRELSMEVEVPDHPGFVGALGAAIVAAEAGGNEDSFREGT